MSGPARDDRPAEGLRVGLIGGRGFLGQHIKAAIEDAGGAAIIHGRTTLAVGEPNAVAAAIHADRLTDIVFLSAHSNPADPDWRQFYEVNAHTAHAVLAGAADARLPGRFLYASATSVYGNAAITPTDETSPLAPLNHYGASKALGERFVAWFADRLNVGIVRPSNCFGAGQNPRFLPAKLVRAFAGTAETIALGDTTIARDFVDARDAAAVFLRMLLTAEPPAVVNAASGRATRISALVDALTALTGHHPRIAHAPSLMRAGDMTHQCCAIVRANAIGAPAPRPLAETLAWMLSAESNAATKAEPTASDTAA